MRQFADGSLFLKNAIFVHSRGYMNNKHNLCIIAIGLVTCMQLHTEVHTRDGKLTQSVKCDNLPERQRIRKPAKESSCAVELSFNWGDPEIKPIATPFKLLEKHKGDVAAAGKELAIKGKRKRVKKAYDKLSKKMHELEKSFNVVAEDVNRSIKAMMAELKKTAYTPLLGNVDDNRYCA